MRICHRWMQEETTDHRDLSDTRCTTARDEKRIGRMDRVATSRTIAQQTQSVTHHSMSTRTIRRRLS
ncbi:hypothetical protein TNCV_142431 [Trichonephila clavipes]|nr:hypothetical protein TNCV_142431 [Trichonephila clavipes]